MTLPIELLLKIFENVDFINLIKLRLICKNWKYIIDNFRIIKQLTIFDQTIYEPNKIDGVVYLNGFQMARHHIFKKIIGSNVLHDLKYLNYLFSYRSGDKNKFIHLNCFKLLQRLYLEISSYEEDTELILVHPNIKRLTVLENVSGNGFSMEINCPKCEKLEIYSKFDLTDFDIVYPEKVKILKFDFGENEDTGHEFFDEIDKFINVEQLKMAIYSFYYSNEISTQISKLSKLKKIAIEFEFLFRSEDESINIDDSPKIFLIKIIPPSFTSKFSFIHRVNANDHIDNEDQFIKFLNPNPKLTKCLVNVGFTIIPSLIFILIILFEINFIFKSKNKKISYNKYNVCRQFVCLFAIITNVITLYNYIYALIRSDSVQYTISDLLASISKLSLYLLYDLIDLFSEKKVLIFLQNKQMKSKKQVKKLIDDEIGKEIRNYYSRFSYYGDDIDHFFDTDNSDDIEDSEDTDNSDDIDDSEDADNTDNIDDSEDADDSDDLNESPEVILIDSDD